MKFNIPDLTFEKVNNAVLITGSARSGTTIMGKLLHSLSHVEYTFEPPTLFPLIAAIDEIDLELWRLLFSTYLYEDFFNGAVAGRNLNLNKNDDSCVYYGKSEQEINKRLSSGLVKTEIEQMTENGVIGFKLPDIVPFVDKIKERFPGLRVILMKREPLGTISSLLKKGWYSDYSLKHENRLFPMVSHEDTNIPYWVAPEDYEDWISMDEINRCAYYVVKMNGDDLKSERLEIDYDDLSVYPNRELERIEHFLNLEKGLNTDMVLQSIKKVEKEPGFELNQIREDFRSAFKI